MLNYRSIAAIAFFLCLFSPSAIAQSTPASIDSLSSPVTSVTQLSDVQSTDWALQALRSISDQYGCIAGNPNGTFRGHQPLSRFEFAAALNLCLTRLNERIMSAHIKQTDLEILRRLQIEFSSELTTLRGRVHEIEARTTTLEKQQFSTTTKLQGIVVMAANAGGFTGNRIVDIRGNPITGAQPNATLLYRASLVLDTSFTGKDLLRILVEAGSEGIGDNAAGFLEPTLGSVLDYSAKPPTGSTLGLSRVMYTFNPASDLEVSVGPVITLTDFVDRNRYANTSFQDFSTLAFVNNYVLFPVSGLGAGGAIRWKLGNGAFNINAGYVALEAQNPSNQGLVRGISPISQALYPSSRGESGLFGDTHQGIVELEYAPLDAFSLRLQYAGGRVLDNRFDAIGANLEWSVSPRFAVFGRYGYSWYNNTVLGDLNPQYWMAGITLKDLFKPGAFAGIAVGQPFIERNLGTGTQTNIEAFYSFPVNDNLRLSPVVQVITNPSNQTSNGTIFTGTLRTVLFF
ncbi:iron uptake porin [Leptolyngbya sp. AN03gr2]|uniref:iron uptake porin n=1 Tax=unclassified Leptolyngbya TaxID=2650499 RepID=UPI003D31DF5B